MLLKILFACDDAEKIKIIGKFLSAQHYQVLVATSVTQALLIAAEKLPDVIIAELPENNSFTSGIKSNQKTVTIPLIVVAEKIKNGNGLNKHYSSQDLLDKIQQIGSFADKATQAESPSSPLKKTIMVVDDIEINRSLIVDFFSDQPFNIIEASGGKDSIEKLNKNKADLILLDIEMPEMDGWQTIQEYKKMGYSFPVIALTAHHGDAEIERKFKHYGFNEILHKPIKKQKLLQEVCKCLLLKPTTTDKASVKKNTKTNSYRYVNISNLLRVAPDDIQLQKNTYQKFRENMQRLYACIADEKNKEVDNVVLQKELHTFINMAHYFCKPMVVKKAKELQKITKTAVLVSDELQDFANVLDVVKQETAQLKFN